MEQLELTPASLRTAVEDEIRDAGGWHAVAAVLYPDKYRDSPDAAERHLRNSVDPNHTQKLCIYQHQIIKALAKKEKGRVASLVFDCREHGYTTPTPIQPEDERAMLQRQYIDAVSLLKGIATKMERVA